MLKLLPKGTEKVIVAPLNWGLGHACRSIPIIQELIIQDIEVVLASDGEALGILQETFPNLQYEVLEGYDVQYKSSSLWAIVFSNAWRVFRAIMKEGRQAKMLLKKHRPDVIISDSRFGFHSRECHNVIISHQLNMQAGSALLGWLMNTANYFLLKKFDQIWVPDFEDRRLSGDLSKEGEFKNVSYIGPQSNLKKKELDKNFDLAIILSGPEPAREHLEKTLIKKFGASDQDIILVRGTNEITNNNIPERWKVHNRVGRKMIEEIIQSSHQVISRSGYTSIMDYYHLGVQATLIPTPGQSEQEYLAEYLDRKYGFVISSFIE